MRWQNWVMVKNFGFLQGPIWKRETSNIMENRAYLLSYITSTLIDIFINWNFHKKKFWFFKNALKIKKFNFQIQIGLFSTFCMIEWKHTLFTGHLKTLHFCIKRIHELLTLMENSFQKGGLFPLQYFTLINFQTFNFDTKKP